MYQFYDHFMVFITEYKATMMGFILAFFMALWRTAKTTGKADWLEACMCAGFTVGVASILDYYGMPQSISIGVGSFIGYMGTSKVSEFVTKKLNLDGSADK